MAVDERYTDNVVLKKSALQNLLTNIRNYPIVDVDFMEEADVDEAYGDNVWENYTQNTPCIKITYGDPDTTKGNIIFHADNRAKIAQAKKEIVRLKAILAQWNYYKNRWTQIKANSKAEKEKKVQEIAVLTSSFNSLVNNTKTFLTVVYPALRANFVSQFNTDTFNQNINASDGSLSESTQVFTRETISQTIDNETYSLTFELLTPYARTWIVSALNQVANALSYAGHTSEATIIQDFKEFVLQYNDIIIDEVYNSSNVQFVFEEIDTSITPYQEGTVYFTVAQGRPGEYNYMPVTESTIANWANIPNVYILTNATRLEEFIGKGTTNLNKQQVLNSVSSQIETIMNEIINLLDAQITTADTHLQHLTQDIVWFTTTDYNDESIGDYGSRSNEHSFAYTNGGVAAELYSIADLEACISYWQNQINRAALDADGHPLMYGYKYVKVGDHVDFSSNQSAMTAVNSESIQKYGTIRTDVNGTTYEITVKGLDNSSTETLRISTGTSTNVVIGQAGEEGGTNNIVNLYPVGRTDSSLGKSDNPWDVIYGNTLMPGSTTKTIGSADTAWNAIYVNNIIPGSNNGTIGSADTAWSAIYANNITSDSIMPDSDNGTIGSANTAWSAIYANTIMPGSTTKTLGSETSPWSAVYANNFTLVGSGNNDAFSLQGGLTSQFLRGNGNGSNPVWTNELMGPIIITSANGAKDSTIPTNAAPSNNTGADLRCSGAGFFGRNLTAAKVFNAVFNDYAEYRTTIDLEPGRVVIDNDDGSLSCATKRLQPGAQIISDTFGHAMGGTSECQTPLAVAGRVLVYPYQSRENYHAGMAVCSAPNGTVDIMTREEIKEYPDCIVGIVSEIPQYETWGSDNVNVNGRIWIKIK